MTPVFTARRRAEDFNHLVEQDSTGLSGTRFDAQLSLVAQLRDLPAPEPAAGFTADLRERLMAAADTLLVPSEDTQRLTLPPRRTARDRVVAVAVGGVAVVGATTSLAIASQSALPGDMLYPLKRALESAETQLHTSDEAKAETLLVHATDRLDEATALSRGGDLAEAANVAQALVDFADQATGASDLLLAEYDRTGEEAPIEGLREFASSSLQTLTELESMLPDQARDELQYAVQVLDEIDDAAARACPSCEGGIDQIPPVLLSAGGVGASDVTVVPQQSLPGPGLRPDGTQDGSDGRGKGGQKDGDGDDAGGGPLSQVGVGNGSGDDSGGGSSGTKDPVKTLTDELTGKGDGKPASGGGGLTGVPEVDAAVDDVTGTVDDTLPDLP